MRIRPIIGAILAAGLALPQPVAARDEQITLAASSPWVVDYADESCALRRQFGGPERPVILEMRQFAPESPDFHYVLTSEHFPLNRNRVAAEVAVRFIPDTEFTDAYLAFNLRQVGDRKGVTFGHSLFAREQAAFRASPQANDPAAQAAFGDSLDVTARVQQITGIEVRNAFADDLVLQTGSLAQPMNAMRSCLDELLLHWGIDVEAHRNLRQGPQPIDQVVWARRLQQAYPSSMAGNGEQAVLRIRLNVSAEGRTSSCHMQVNMGNEQFERTACEILTSSARFTPAIDANGNAIASYYLLTMTYTVE